MRSSYSTPAALSSASFSAFELVDLRAEDHLRIFDDRLDQREHVERVARALAVEPLDGVHHEQAERLEKREVVLQLGVQANAAALGRGPELDDARPATASARARALACLCLRFLGGRLEAVFAPGASWRGSRPRGRPSTRQEHAVASPGSATRAARAPS